MVISIQTMWCFSQTCGTENQVSSTTVSGVRGVPVSRTAPIEDVKTTRFMLGNLAQDDSTFSVPFIAGSNISAWKLNKKKCIE